MTLAIGDIQGCFDSLLAVLDAAAPRPDEPIWLVGDLVNRGPASLQTLRWAREQGERVVAVLGNHDLNLLAIAAGLRRPHRSDTLDAILGAPDRDALLAWLRHRPLAHFDGRHLMVHAGVLPQWSAQRTMALSGEVERTLAGEGWRDFLAEMYGNQPARWDDQLQGAARLRVIVNALTRMRLVTADGTMEFETKEGLGRVPEGYMPWFDVPQRASADVTLVTGHWSTLGLVMRPDLIALDTGCVWGGELTAVRLEDRAVFRAACPRAAAPGRH